jgi:ABC-type transport system involved in cytochrome c biogenesis permease component
MFTRLIHFVPMLISALTPAENPLLLKSVRVETRQRRPLLGVLGVSLLLLLQGAVIYWGIWRQLPFSAVHWLLQRDWSLLRIIMVACCGVHAYVVLFSVMSRNQRAFAQEAQQNTLEQLLITPHSSAELLLRMAIHTFYYGMLLALVGLPLYILWAMLGDLTWWQLLALYLLFARVAFSPPSPQHYVTFWRMRHAGQQTATQRKQMRQQAAPYGVAIGFANIAFQILIHVGTRTNIGRRWLGTLFKSLWAMLPAALKGIAPTIPLSWLYFSAVLLTLPLTWFQVHLPPIVFALPLMLLGRAHAILRGAAFISSNMLLMTAPAGSAPPTLESPSPYVQQTRQRIAKLEAICAVLFNIALLGYLWKPLIADGGLAWLVSRTASNPAHALAGLTFCMGIVGVLLTMYALRDRLTTNSTAGVTSPAPPHSHPPTHLHALRPFAYTVLQLALACLLGGVSPFNRPTLIVAGKVLAIGVATAAFCLAARWWQQRTLEAQPPGDEAEDSNIAWSIALNPQVAVWHRRHGAWFSNPAWRVTWLLLLVVWVYPFAALLCPQPLVQISAAVSPMISFASLTPRTDELLQSITFLRFAPLPPWWMGLLLQPLAALLWCALALRLRPRRAVAEQKPLKGWRARMSERVRLWNERLMTRLSDEVSARFDNPVAVKDIRVRARRENWAVRTLTFPLMVWLAAFIALSAMTWRALFVPTPPTFLIVLFANFCPELSQLSLPAQMFLSVLFLLLLTEWFVSWILTLQPGTAFDGERDSGTLGFLLTTPLRDRDIILGKWLGQTVDAWLLMLFYKSMSVVLALAAAMAGAPQTLLVYLAASVFFAALMFSGSILGIALGARFKARGAGAGWALVATGPLQVGVMALLIAVSHHRLPLMAYALPFLLGAMVHAILGIFALRWGARVIGRLRVGDVAFEGQKREN